MSRNYNRRTKGTTFSQIQIIIIIIIIFINIYSGSIYKYNGSSPYKLKKI